MKQYLTNEQTAKLIELGFEKPKNTQYVQRVKARNLHSPFIEFGEPEFEGSYSIGELLSFLPRVISNNKFDYATINIFHDTINWVVGYVDTNDIMRFITSDIEFIDALCTICRKLKEGGSDMSNTVKLESRFYVTKILKPNTLIKELDLHEGCIIEVSMVIANRVKPFGGNGSYARYVDIFNVANGEEKKNISLNVFASMIGANFLLINY